MEIEAGQQQAIGVLSASADAVAAAEESDKAVMVKATATIGGREVAQNRHARRYPAGREAEGDDCDRGGAGCIGRRAADG